MPTFDPHDVQGTSFSDYVTKVRKHSKATLRKFKIGLADGEFCQWAIDNKGFTPDELVAAGLMNEKTGRDYWQEDMLLFPHFVGDKVSHFSQKSPTKPDRDYQARNECRHPNYWIYNQNAAIGARELVLVEGENDLLSVAGKGGYPTVVATNGNPKNRQIDRLKKLKDLKRVILCFDNDAGGRRHAMTFKKKFRRKGVVIVDVSPALGGSKDIDDYLTRSETPGPWFEGLIQTRTHEVAPRDILKAFQIEVVGEEIDHSIVVWNNRTRKFFQIKNLDNWGPLSIMQALGEEAVKERLATGDSRGTDGSFEQRQLKEAIAFVAAEAARIDVADKIGQGIWRKENKLLIVNGSRAYVYDDAKFEQHSRPRFGNQLIAFEAGKEWGQNLIKRVERMTPEAAAEAFEALCRILGQWNWTHGADAVVAAALVVATWVQACWTWRPLVSITGPTNCGKSTLFSWLASLLGPWRILADRSTEAGLRQAIGQDSMPVLIDEFDKYRKRQEVLELFRTSSRGGQILRGTADQTGQRFGLKHIAWFAAIESGDIWGQDRNRFIRLELKLPADPGSLALPESEDAAKMGRGLAAIAIWLVNTAIQLSDQIKQTRIQGIDSRLIESFAVPAATAAAIEFGKTASVKSAAKRLEEMIAGRSTLESQAEPDERQLLTDILSANIRVTKSRHGSSQSCELSVAQLLNDPTHIGELEAKGLRIVKGRDHGAVLFLVPEVIRAQLLRNSRWAESRIDQVLVRLPGAERCQQRCGGLRPSGIALPWPACLGDEVTL